MKIVVQPMGMVGIGALILLLSGVAIARHAHPDNLGETAAVAAGDSSGVQSEGSAAGLIYGDAMTKEWQAPGWSWAKDVNYSCTDEKYSGTSSIRAHLKQYEGVKLHKNGPIDLKRFDRLVFHIRAGANGLSNIMVSLGDEGKAAGAYKVELANLPPQEWCTVCIPFEKFAPLSQSPANEIWLQSFAAPDQHFYVDDIRMLSPGEPDPTGDLVTFTAQK